MVPPACYSFLGINILRNNNLVIEDEIVGERSPVQTKRKRHEKSHDADMANIQCRERKSVRLFSFAYLFFLFALRPRFSHDVVFQTKIKDVNETARLFSAKL